MDTGVSDKEREYYSGLIKGKSLYELNELGLDIIGDNGEYLLLDSINKHIYSLDELNIDDSVRVVANLIDYSKEVDIIDRILDVIPDADLGAGMGGADNKLPKKKKR